MVVNKRTNTQTNKQKYTQPVPNKMRRDCIHLHIFDQRAALSCRVFSTGDRHTCCAPHLCLPGRCCCETAGARRGTTTHEYTHVWLPGIPITYIKGMPSVYFSRKVYTTGLNMHFIFVLIVLAAVSLQHIIICKFR